MNLFFWRRNKRMKKLLGKRPPKIDPRTFKLSNYLPPSPPPAANWLKLSKWDMYGNDAVGDCVEACAGHMINIWDSYSVPNAKQPTTKDIIAAYSAVTGYRPGDPNTDQGTVMLDFLKYWRNVGIAGHRIYAFAAIKPGDLKQLQQAVWLFGAAMVGLAMPITAQNQPNGWSVPGNLTGDAAPGSWGGHCVPVGAYQDSIPARLRNAVITWGSNITMSDFFYETYCDEAYAVLSQEWMLTNGNAASGFNFTQLQADLSAL